MEKAENLKIGIIGAGKMGMDIFNNLIDFAFSLTLVCLNEVEREKHADSFSRRLDRQHRNGLINDVFFELRKSHTIITACLDEASGCDIIIEAITEDADAKRALFNELADIVRSDSVVVSNSSSIKPSLLVHDPTLRERAAGLHFFYPVKLKNIVEVITTSETSGKTVEIILAFLSAIKKNYILTHEDNGFLLNKIFLDFQAQAYRYYDEGLIPMEELDAIIRRDLFPVGVFEFFDSVGIDVMYQSVLNYTDDNHDRKFYLPLLQGMKKLIEEHRLGRKSGAGFYDYSTAHSEIKTDYGYGPGHEIIMCLSCLYINSSYKIIEKNICAQDILENAIKEYMGIEKGPFALAEEIGREKIHETLVRQYRQTEFAGFIPSPLIGRA